MDEKVTKLGDVSNLNIELIHDKATSLIVICLLIFLLSFLGGFCFAFALNFQNKAILYICLVTFMISLFASCIAFFISFYKLILAFYYSDMNEFVQFL